MTYPTWLLRITGVAIVFSVIGFVATMGFSVAAAFDVFLFEWYMASLATLCVGLALFWFVLDRAEKMRDCETDLAIRRTDD